MPKLSDDERAAFLAERGHLLRVATIDERGAPRLVPVWFTTRDDAVLFTPRAGSGFLADVRRDPRVALSIDEAALPYRKVTVRGRAEIRHDVGDDDAWRDLYREIAERYIDPDAAEAYLRATWDQPRALLAVPLVGSEVTSWRLPIEGEAGTGIWARRYYEPGTRMAERP